MISAAPSPASAEPARPTAIGLVRGTTVVLRVFGGAEPLHLTAWTTDGAEILLEPVTLRPGHSRALRALREALSAKVRRRLKRLDATHDLAFTLPKALVRSLSLRDANGAEVEWATVEGALDALLPTDEPAFRAALSFGNRRHADAETVRFITGQIIRGPGVAPAPEGFQDGYLINAFVISIYKSIELDRHDPPDETQAIFERMNSLLAAMPTTGLGVRSDVEQLFVSMRMALWQMHMGQGEVDRARDRLDEIVVYHDLSTERPVNCNRSYNLTKSMFMAGLLALARDDADLAGRLFEDTVNVFRRGVASVRSRTGNLTWFAEMAATHQVAVNAMTLQRRLIEGTPIGLQTILDMSPSAVRVEDPAYLERLKAAVASAWVEPRTQAFTPLSLETEDTPVGAAPAA